MKDCGHGGCHGNTAERYAAADINEKLMFNIRGLGHTLRFTHECKGSQQRIISILNGEGAMTQRDLTVRLDIQPGSVSEVISKLENAGLIFREQSSDDRRTAYISLTDEGRTQAEEAMEHKKKRREEMFACLTDEEKQTLLALLEKLHSDWKQKYRDAGGRRCSRENRDESKPSDGNER